MTAPRSTLATPAVLAFVAACIGVGLFSVMDAVMKGLSLAIGAYNALLWRNAIGVIVGGLLYFGTRKAPASAAAIRIHVRRGVVVAGMALLFFWAITVLPLAEAIALSFIAPLIALYLAAVLLGERISRHAIIASLLGIAGVALIMAARFGGSNWTMEALWGALAVFGSAILFAYNLILARQQAQMAQPAEIAFFQNLVVLTTLSLAAPWLAVWPAAAHWPGLAGAAALALTSLLILSWAYARAEAQVLIPVEYTAFIWAALLGWYVFDEAVTWPIIAGTALIVTGCLIAARGGRAQPMQVEESIA